MDKNFVVDKEKCVKCGLCTKDCVSAAIKKDEEGYPQMADPLRCIECQHCFAICPKGAISILNNQPENAQNIEQTDSENILNLIQSRRSTRHYKRMNVDKIIIDKLKDMLNYTPTGCNSHKLHFSIIDDIEVMDDFRSRVNKDLIKILNSKPADLLSDTIKKFSKYKDDLTKGEDVLFRNAPHLIVVSAPIDSPCPQQDGVIALSYFELYANSLRLGTLWCGFVEAILKLFPTYCEYLNIPDNYMPVYVMLFGYPNVEFKRTTIPKPYEFESVKIKNLKTGVFDKVKRIFWNFVR